MTDMDQAATTRRAARLLSVLALLLGLLAMHGLTTDHHATAAASGSHRAVVAAPADDGAPADDEATAHHVGHDSPTGLTAGDGAAFVASVTAPAGPTCDDGCAEVVALCLAVLADAVAVLLLADRRAGPSLLTPSPRSAGTSAPPAPWARGPDPVRELCVSRT